MSRALAHPRGPRSTFLSTELRAALRSPGLSCFPPPRRRQTGFCFVFLNESLSRPRAIPPPTPAEDTHGARSESPRPGSGPGRGLEPSRRGQHGAESFAASASAFLTRGPQSAGPGDTGAWAAQKSAPRDSRGLRKRRATAGSRPCSSASSGLRRAGGRLSDSSVLRGYGHALRSGSAFTSGGDALVTACSGQLGHCHLMITAFMSYKTASPSTGSTRGAKFTSPAKSRPSHSFRCPALSLSGWPLCRETGSRQIGGRCIYSQISDGFLTFRRPVGHEGGGRARAGPAQGGRGLALRAAQQTRAGKRRDHMPFIRPAGDGVGTGKQPHPSVHHSG